MIKTNDVVVVNLTSEEIEDCKQHPVLGFRKLGTGQLKAIGNLAMQKALGIPKEEYEMQMETAQSMGVSFVCEIPNGRMAGISPTVSKIDDDNITEKKLSVPAGQLYKHPKLKDHYTVGVFVKGKICQDEQKTVDTVEQVYVAGFTPTADLQRFVTKGGKGAFTLSNASLAVVDCNLILHPMPQLVKTVRYKKGLV